MLCGIDPASTERSLRVLLFRSVVEPVPVSMGSFGWSTPYLRGGGLEGYASAGSVYGEVGLVTLLVLGASLCGLRIFVFQAGGVVGGCRVGASLCSLVCVGFCGGPFDLLTGGARRTSSRVGRRVRGPLGCGGLYLRGGGGRRGVDMSG